MSITVYNSLTREKEDFRPLNEGHVNMYVCGPTVYALSHIGHARSAVAFDVIFRYLSYSGYDVNYTRNYTDIDDKIIKRANDEGRSSTEVAEENIREFDIDMEGLGVLLPTNRPKATETIPEIVDFISTLIEKGAAYESGGDVFFSVRSFKGYGKLSGKNIDELESGARVDINEQKEDPLDFALWKSSKPGEPSWDSPWGGGRPGWHIECSAMCLAGLGETIDIHGGGKDLIFPHHENEIAQSESATGKEYVKYWMHNGFVNIDKEKMSKSIGNIIGIRDVLGGNSTDGVRLFLLSSHYRSPIDFTENSLTESEAQAERYYTTVARMEKDFSEVIEGPINEKGLEERLRPILDAMNDDFNTAGAIGHLFKDVSEANRLMDEAGRGGVSDDLRYELPIISKVFKTATDFLGTLNLSPEEYFDIIKKKSGIDSEYVERLIEERLEARAEKNFDRADEIRGELTDMGVIIKDSPGGTEWRAKGN